MKRRPVFLGLVTNNTNTGKQTLAAGSLHLLKSVQHLGELHGQVHGFEAGHRRGLRLGFLLGLLAGCVLVGAALKLGAVL